MPNKKYQIVPKIKTIGVFGGLLRNISIREKPTIKRPRGRPCQRWLDVVKKDISDTDESRRMNVMRWKSLIEACNKRTKEIVII